MARPFEKFEPMPVHLGVGMGAVMGIGWNPQHPAVQHLQQQHHHLHRLQQQQRLHAAAPCMGMGLYQQQMMLIIGGGGAHGMMGAGVGQGQYLHQPALFGI